MARFDTSGLDDVLREMEAAGELVGETADEMLLAGAQVVSEEWKRAAREAGLVDTGAMLGSIGYPRKPTTSGDVRSIDIYPQGKDERGIRNAEKAFVNHYGTSRLPATHFIDRADERSGPRVQAAFEEIWDRHLGRR